MQLQVAHSYQNRQQYERAQEITSQAILRARTALVESRRAIDDLRLELVDPCDLQQRIEAEVNHFTGITGIACEVHLVALATIPSSLHIHTLRIIKEGLTNIVRHARAHRTRLTVCRHGSIVEIELRDDGIGFDPASIEKQSGHYGLLGLYERAHLMNAHFEILSALGAGTTMRFQFYETAGEVEK